MKKIIVRLALTVLSAACYTPGLWAAYDDVGVGARVTGMGNAFTAVADDVYSVYYNPAGLGTLQRPELATTYSKLFSGLSDDSNLQNSFVAYAHPLDQGRQGALAASWNYFTLDDLYQETTLTAAYGRRIFAERLPNGLFAGVGAKYLSRSLGRTAAADNAFSNTGQANQGADPVLQKGGRSNTDFDFGLLYRLRPRISVGLAVQHLLEPNIAISESDTDRLGRNAKLGAAYQTSWTTFSSELQLLKAPNGSTDRTVIVGMEKWLPTLVHGTFGLRGAIGVGDRDYRQISLGLSYKIYRMQVDYGFAIPLGTVSGTYGTHRMGLSFRFGRPRGAEPKFSEAVLENMRELAEVGTPEFRAQAEDLALYKRTAQREFLRQARVDAGEGRFAEARAKLSQAAALNASDALLAKSLERLSAAAAIFPEIHSFRTDAGEAALYEGVMDFLASKDREALRKVSYAQSLSPADDRYEQMMQAIEARAGLQRAPIPQAPTAAPTMGREKVVGASLALMEVALREGDYDKVLKLAGEVLEIAPENVLAHKRTATALYAKKDYPKALKSLRAAYRFESDADAKRTLKSYIDALVSLIERKARESEPEARPAQMEKNSGASPLELQRIYEAGVDLYAQGRLSEAASMFQKLLDLDPKNSSAKRALQRVQAEILQGGAR
ncbi:MAG: type IX secretion system membrane protein PorP/SprF [Elusimicrobiota bacterium]|jgi:tetratricopeptide (TPR) repeat protein